jgi:hypothetical protein
MIISNPASFRAEAQFQRVCAYCEKADSFQSHHVVPKQDLRRRGLPLYDTRGALRLCEGLDTDKCHMRIEKGIYVLETAKLLQVNICYVWETLDMAGQNLLERNYTGVDRRYTLHTEGNCPLCQR